MTSDPNTTTITEENTIMETREKRARRAAARQGLKLVKSRVRNPNIWEFGTFGIADATTNGLVADVAGSGVGLDLVEVEEFLAERNAS